MTFLAGALITLLIAGYPLHRAVVRASAATEREAEACTDVLGLLATVAYADARINHERQSNQALLRIGAKAVRKYADAALDAEAAEMFRTVAEARADIAEDEAKRAHAALRGLLTNLARQDELRPDQPCGRVLAFERNHS